jgi:predicted RNase H-like HicB family nuclease
MKTASGLRNPDCCPAATQHGKDRGEAVLRFQEAAKAHLEALLESGRPIPPAFRDKFVLAG